MAGGATIRFNSFGDGTGNVWASFMVPITLGGGGQRNGARVQLCQISTGRMRGVDERYYHWIGDSCPGLH